MASVASTSIRNSRLVRRIWEDKTGLNAIVRDGFCIVDIASHLNMALLGSIYCIYFRYARAKIGTGAKAIHTYVSTEGMGCSSVK